MPAKPVSPPKAASASGSGSAAPAASIEIDYAKKGDTLESLTVTQFTGATILLTHPVDAQRSASLVRFDGGIPVWQFHSERSIFNPLSELETASYHVTKVRYGELPAGFAQDVPDVGPPAPLEPGSYYVFTIERASGAKDYQAVKVNSDGSLEVYNAEPRAGTSYRLCCNVSPGFPESPKFSPDLPAEP